MPAPLVIPTWYSTAEAAAAIGVTPRTLYRIIDDGDLKAHRFGRVIRIRDEDLAAYFEGSTIKAGDLGHLIARNELDLEEASDAPTSAA